MSQSSSAPLSDDFPEIEGYAIDAVLGRGTTGVVYRARQLSVDREVALKVMHPELVRNARSIKRLQREARTAARLTHPNLISSIDMGETVGTWWFAMELVHGESLSARLERSGRMKERDALPIFIKLCDALEHASQKGVVHRDVKPANILLEEGDNPRLVDLGLARVEDDPMLTRTGATLGTPHYISPEQARDPAQADVRSDLWSLGATLYHTVCGRPPFTGTATAEILSGVLYGPIPSPADLRPELSKGLVLVLRKCLSRDPSRRYHTPVELLEDLKRVQSHKPPAIKRSALEPLDPALSRERKRSLLSVGGVAAALALLVLTFAWRPWEGSNDVDEVTPSSEPSDWPAITRLREDVESSRLLLRDAWVELESLEVAMPRTALPQWSQVRDFLLQELEQVLFEFYRAADDEVERLLAEHDFPAATEYIEVSLGLELGLMSGFAGPTLPRERDRANFLRFVETRRELLSTQQAAALQSAVARISQWAEGIYFPRLTRLQGQGRWTEVRELLGRDVSALYEESGADLRGLEIDELTDLLGDLSLELEGRVQRLESDWFQLDSRTLRRAVADLSDELEAKLRARELLRAREDFEVAFDALLAEHTLDLETLEAAREHHSLDLFHERSRMLFELEEMLLEEDAAARLAELDAQAEPLFADRRYEQALSFWESHLEDSVLQPRRDSAAIRIEEAQELVAFLQRAARGVRDLERQRVSLKQGGIAVSGEVGLRGAPLERGFTVMISSNTTKDYLLRETPGLRGEVLESASIERFALEGADVERDLGLLKQRAIFRYREGDLEGASRLLRSELLAAGELLVYDLGLRIDRKLGREQDVRERRREHALNETERLTQPGLPQGDTQRVVLQIARLLREYGDVLEASEKARLRTRRDLLEQGVQPSTREDFLEIFGPDECRLWAQNKVSMSFDFDASMVGAWQRGDWVFTGQDSWRGPQVSSLDELDRSSVPTLMLRAPLLLDDGTTTVTVRMRQPEDSPPELFMISALGFHAACVGPLGGRPPSLLVDTSSLADVADRARAGKGLGFNGLTAGDEHTITMRMTRASGKVVVIVDGVRVLTANRVSPKDQPRSSSLSFRALEPLEVIGVQLEGTRR